MPLKRLIPPASEPVPGARGRLVRDTVPTGYKVMRSGAPHGCERAQPRTDPRPIDDAYIGGERTGAYLGEKGIGMKRSRMSEVLLAEGLKWRQEETWFGTRVDPEFERKRGCSSASTPLHPRAA